MRHTEHGLLLPSSRIAVPRGARAMSPQLTALGSAAGQVTALGAAVGAVVVPWYLGGGIALANCIAAYQAKGAANYAASKVNLASPGTYDLTDGTAFPTWASATGWTFALGNQYLRTGITPADTTWSIIVQFANAAAWDGMSLAGYYNAAGAFLVQNNNSSSNMSTYNGLNYPSGLLSVAPSMNAGNYGFAGKQPYRNGSPEASTIPAGAGTFGELYIGNGNGLSQYYVGDIIALAIYNVTITPAQFAAVATAMAAL